MKSSGNAYLSLLETMDSLEPAVRDRFRAYKRSAYRVALFTRGWLLRGMRGQGQVQNIYHACIQKTGSQWVKAVLSDRDVVRRSGLVCHPQFRYEWGEFKRRFPPYTFVPGLYVPYGLYEEITKPAEYRTIYVLRDPRDVVVSWYFSMRDTHVLMGKVPKFREDLQSLSKSDGLAYCIRYLQLKFSFVRSWWQHRGDPRIKIVRFENLTADPVSGFTEILRHCEVNISEDELAAVLDRYTKDKMRRRDLESRDDGKSHYRSNSGGWEEHFEDRHRELFMAVNGNLVELLGY